MTYIFALGGSLDLVAHDTLFALLAPHLRFSLGGLYGTL